MSEKRTFSKGTVIFKEGSWELSMYDIIAGKVGIYANYGKENESLLTELEAGKYFGEMGMIDALPRSATAVALEDTEAAVINYDDFENYFSEKPEKVIEIFKNLSSRLRELSAEYVDTCSTVSKFVAESDPAKSLWSKIKKLIMLSAEYSALYNDAMKDYNFFSNTNYYI